jgi:hypothetical protein
MLPPCDLLIVGDGSGSGAWHPEPGVGWAAVATDVFGNHAKQVSALYDGNVSLAELSAAAHGLWHYHNTVTKKRPPRDQPLRVVYPCDNQQIVTESRRSTRRAFADYRRTAVSIFQHRGRTPD